MHVPAYVGSGASSPEPSVAPSPSAPSSEALLRAQHLELLQALHMGVAHDLRAPINALYLHLELLRHSPELADATDGMRQRVQRLTEAIGRDVARLHDQVEALVAQLAPPSGDRRPLDLSRLVRECGLLLESQAKQSTVTLEIVHASSPAVVLGCASKLQAMLLSLLMPVLVAPTHARLRLEVKVEDDQVMIALDPPAGAPTPLVAEVASAHGGIVVFAPGVPPAVAALLLPAIRAAG